MKTSILGDHDALQGMATWDVVVEDMRRRDAAGFEKYGVRLRPENGRVSVIDAYEEALDLVVYLRNTITEMILRGEIVCVGDNIYADSRGDRRHDQGQGDGALSVVGGNAEVLEK